ncbi:uncharacterized protein LOC115312425 [Ixodes scapularis]|uniref:uncharacterized protein LOC115312425 n=1 Tax=Ixodes scapularis TaxID=6945 RepID=UPI001C391E83|nr:uncharacterized protein LOC115312425 [Ixodes scapularis]
MVPHTNPPPTSQGEASRSPRHEARGNAASQWRSEGHVAAHEETSIVRPRGGFNTASWSDIQILDGARSSIPADLPPAHHRLLLGRMEGKAARLRQFDETADQVVRRIEQTSALLEERLKDVVQEAGAKPVALILEEVQEAAKKGASVPCFGSSEEECSSQKSRADPLDEAITYWSCMCVVLGQYLKEEPKKAGSCQYDKEVLWHVSIARAWLWARHTSGAL